MTTTSVFVTGEFEGIHYWAEAPDEVDFLRNKHRHMFKVELETVVRHGHREIEFILLKRWLQGLLPTNPDIGNLSCEMIAYNFCQQFRSRWPGREVRCKVSEDGENGAVVETE